MPIVKSKLSIRLILTNSLIVLIAVGLIFFASHSAEMSIGAVIGSRCIAALMIIGVLWYFMSLPSIEVNSQFILKKKRGKILEKLPVLDVSGISYLTQVNGTKYGHKSHTIKSKSSGKLIIPLGYYSNMKEICNAIKFKQEDLRLDYGYKFSPSSFFGIYKMYRSFTALLYVALFVSFTWLLIYRIDISTMMLDHPFVLMAIFAFILILYVAAMMISSFTEIHEGYIIEYRPLLLASRRIPVSKIIKAKLLEIHAGSDLFPNN